MKNFKSFVILIILMLSVGATLQAQGCFDMEVNCSRGYTNAECNITITTYSHDVDIYGTYGDYETCEKQSTCTYTWSYNIVCDYAFNEEIICELKGRIPRGCERSDGCVVIIDGGLCEY